jgi:phospho-N-acetylmuramoyl-pentapeptide-transferase
MLHYLFTEVLREHTLSNLFRYLTFRTGGAIFTSLFICMLFGDRVINWLKSLQAAGQPIREQYMTESHTAAKRGTPTMGGIMILASVVISTLLWADVCNMFVWVVMLVAVGFGALGLVDDYIKLTKKHHGGLSGKMKLAGQILISFIAVLVVYLNSPEAHNTSISIPFTKAFYVDLHWLYFAFAVVVIVGASNAVNLTDGLDGLAIVPVCIAVCSFGLIAYLVGNAKYAEYLQIVLVPNSGEVVIACGAILGAGLGFLWFNAPPAQVFMGDTGSLFLGGVLGVMSVITKHEIILAVIGGLFVMETMSVIIQVFFFKRTGRRVFLMSPIHHHFEKKGWSESKIVIRFWILAVIFALIGLSSLKLR